MSTTTKSTTKLLTEATEEQVSTALLRHATRNYPGAVLMEHKGVVPPVGPEQVTYRLGPLEVEELGWSAGGAKVSQRIDVWAPGGEVPKSAPTYGAVHADLGTIGGRVRQARMVDGTTVISGVYTVEVLPFVPLLEGRTEQDPRVALGDRHRSRKVEKVFPVEGTAEHRSQVVHVSLGTGGNVRGALEELRGQSTAAGYVAEVGELKRWPESVGSGSFATASPSRDRVAVLAGVRLEWREA
ncbi:hypothetical protein [Brachybacterium paraconglomeratum]|uniref:hypothetical protein n=1 Tax=Brachybacterium paraconglomeratum TaxID=173362 RepID=UPI003516BFD5